MSLENVAILLNVKPSDQKLAVIYEQTQNRLMAMIGQDSVPERLTYVVDEVAIARYNRLGSEGMSAKSVEGLSKSFQADDFAPYNSEINDYLGNPRRIRGKVRYL